MTKQKERATRTADRTIVMTRIFDAPRELVFEAHTNPDHIPRWWGRRAYTTIVEKMDLRPGGAWRFVQRSPDGIEFAFHGEFREIDPPRRLVWTFEFDGMPGHVILETVTFEALGDKTKLTASSLFETREDREEMFGSGMEGGARETWDRLAELLVLLLTGE